MKYLICFCAPLAIGYVIHLIKYPETMWLAMTMRVGDTKLETAGLFAVVWLEIMSFGLIASLIVRHLS